MRRAIAASAAMVALLLLPVAAVAIVYGEPDGEGHPNVGALLAPVAYSDGTWTTCSGTLIAPTVFLTAAHCDQDVSRVAVTFESSYDPTDPATATTHWGTWNPHPDYRPAQGDPHDIAVVVFDVAVEGITPAVLPVFGSLSDLDLLTPFTAVGYGAQSVTVDHGMIFHYADIRYVATGRLLATNKSWLRISMNPARGDGGTCFADSGGPNFLVVDETEVLAATTITGDLACRATNVVYRLDTESARAFLDDYPGVTLP